MELLESYVKAVRRYLPRAHRNDIAAELSDELRSQIESQSSALGRPLSDDEKIAILIRFGDPMIVARRYRQDAPSLTIGWEFIGPELFPMYLIILGLQATLSVVIAVGVLLYIHLPLGFMVLARTALTQVAVVTTVFTILNLVRRKYPQPWYYPPATLASALPLPRWVSATGLVVVGSFALWWMLVPAVPAMLFGSAAKGLTLAPACHRFYLPVLFLLLIGVAQRAVNLAHPEWTWLLPVTRMLVNLGALAMQYSMIKAFPYVLPAQNSERYRQAADSFNGLILWGFLTWIWVYFLVSAVVYAWYCMPLVRRAFERRNRMDFTRELNGVI